MTCGFNLRNELMKEHSKTQCNKIVKWVGSSQERFDRLFDIFLHDEYRAVQYAAWPISYTVIAHTELMKRHFSELLKNLRKPGIHDSVKRNSVRLLEQIEIPKRYQGEVMDICFHFIASSSEAIAVKAFSITVLENLAKIYPEILPELKLSIETNIPKPSAAIKVRTRRILL